MDIFRKILPDKSIPCILCDGKGTIHPVKEKVEVRFGVDPAHCTSRELAVVMANIPKFWELPAKLGVDPTKIKITFTFEDTGHEMPIRLKRAEDQEKN